MASRGRVKELEKLHQELAGGGSCFHIRSLKRHLGKEISSELLPTTVYLSDFIDAFQGELNRLKDEEEHLKYLLDQYDYKKRMHIESYHEILNTEKYNKAGVMENSRLDLVVEQARELPAMNTNNTADPFFVVKLDDKVIYRSQLIPDTAEPVWNARVAIPIKHKNHEIIVELLDDDQNPESIGLCQIELESFEDQQVHTRWYDLESVDEINAGEVKIVGQWVYNMTEFHQNNAEKYESLLSLTEKNLARVSEQVMNLYEYRGKDLLEAWLIPPARISPSKSRRSQHFLSVPGSRSASQVSSPTQSRKSNYNFPKIEYTQAGCSLDFFAIGMFVTSKYMS